MTTAFFSEIAEQGYQPLLHRATGTIRIDLNGSRRVEHWYLDLIKGNVAVSQRNEPADSVIRTDRRTFERVARGEANAMAAVLRNEMTFEGNPTLIVLLQRLFPYTANQEGRTE